MKAFNGSLTIPLANTDYKLSDLIDAVPGGPWDKACSAVTLQSEIGNTVPIRFATGLMTTGGLALTPAGAMFTFTSVAANDIRTSNIYVRAQGGGDGTQKVNVCCVII